MANNMRWSFYSIWNSSLEEGRSNKPVESRQKIWASELGGSMIDRYLKMTGVQPSNPFTPRALRKFEAGNIWEAIVGYVLRRAGILQARQEWLKYQYEGLLPVTGKLDFIAGGKPDYEKAFDTIHREFDWLPEFISRATANIIQSLREEYPDGLANIILEIKSCSAFMFERYEKNGNADLKHKLQNFHYLKAKSMPEGHIVYISKDDARMLEVGVLNPSLLENDYKKDIETISHYVLNNIEPPKEKFIVFDKDWGQFSANYKVGYSSYLTHLYNFENQKAFDDIYKPIVERWNRVLGRICGSKEMTDNNREAIDEMAKEGFDIEEIKQCLTINVPLAAEPQK
jgi:hypothetical protein